MDPRRLAHARRHWLALDAAMSRLLPSDRAARVREALPSVVEPAARDAVAQLDRTCAPYGVLLEGVPGTLTAALHTIWRFDAEGARVARRTCDTLKAGTDPMTDTDRPPRRHPRHPVSIDCQVEGASGLASMRVSEMSLGGCFVDTRMQFAPNQTVTIRAALPSGAIEFRARVIYMLSGYGFGCAFEPLPDAAREELEKFLAHADA